ncbi:MAG: S24 family peptidase [Desulfatiglandales bacterium]
MKIAGFFKGLKAYTADVREFLQETGYLPADLEPAGESKRIPVLLWTQAGSWQEICDTAQYGEYVETDTKGVFALRVRGESMEAEFHEGDIIGYR